MINQQGFVKSEEICRELSIRGRTLRDDIAKYKQRLLDNGIQVISKHGTGYQLEILDEAAYYRFIAQLLKEEETAQRLLPVYPEDRINYLMKLFLNQEDYLKLDDIAEKIFISRSTLQNDIKEVKERLRFFHLNLINKPYYGMKIEGSEIHKRSCISQYFFHTDSMDELFAKRNQLNELQARIADILFETLDETDFRLTDLGFQNLIVHISIALLRIDEHIEEDVALYMDIREQKEYEIALRLVSRLNKEFHVQLKDIEVCYITIHLLGKKNLQYHRDYAITEEIEILLKRIFEEIKNQYTYHFAGDFELYTVLALHFQPMLDRLKYGLTIQNPLLEEIKQENPIAFEMSVISARIIEQQMGYVLLEAEMGYLALHFALAIERAQKSTYTKKNILIVCASGAGSSQILLYKIKQRFHDYLDKIQVSELYKLKTIDQKEFDFILSTIPIPFATQIPTIEVQYFLNGNDLIHLSDAFKKDGSQLSFVDKYFSESLFFDHLSGKNKEEILHDLIKRTSIIKELPKEFEALVLERETYAATEFGNLVAMPHPMKAVCKETFVSVGLLAKPIKWQKQYVRYIFLMCIEKDSQDNLTLFHETISSLVMDKQALAEFEKQPSMKKMKDILKRIANQEKEHDIDTLFK